MQDKERKNMSPLHAAAVQYQDKEQLPRVLAGGAGSLAHEIVSVAQSHGIPVQKDETLALVLSQLKPGELIPPETYRLVAELVTFLYESDKEWREKHQFLKDTIPSPGK